MSLPENIVKHFTVFEVSSTAHVEMILLPLIVVAMWLAVRWRDLAGAIVLALATAVKPWPVLLLPPLAVGPLRPRRLAKHNFLEQTQ